MKILLLIVSFVIISVHGECTSCASIPKHYEELGCVAVKDNEDDCCPSRFECPDFNAYDKEKCHFKGRSYEKSTNLDEYLNETDCITNGCVCPKYGPGRFSCPSIQCPDECPSDCVKQYDLGKCCSSKIICDKNIIKNLPNCWYNNERFYEGQIIYPSQYPCYRCICDERFDNSTNINHNQNCKKIECGIELLHLADIQSGCVPLYYGTDRCCPIDYRCPSETDVNTSGRTIPVDVDQKTLCKYGNVTLQIGESIVTNTKCTSCTCNIPPIVDCIKKPKC